MVELAITGLGRHGNGTSGRTDSHGHVRSHGGTDALDRGTRHDKPACRGTWKTVSITVGIAAVMLAAGCPAVPNSARHHAQRTRNEGGAAPPEVTTPLPSSGLILAQLDTSLQARVVECEDLTYTTSADPSLDRPDHVRAASGLARMADGRLVIAQDDASFLGIRGRDGSVDALPLPATGGRRRFEPSFNNLSLKPDMESCATLADGRVLAFGSGTIAARQQIAVVQADGATLRMKAGEPFYGALLAHQELGGTAMNIEGATVIGDRLRLFQRASGAEGKSAYADFALTDFLGWLDEDREVPRTVAVVSVDLGREGGVSYGFADATTYADRVYFLAGAEDNDSPMTDGEVVGTRAGWLSGSEARYAPILAPSGEPSKVKLEGLVIDPEHSTDNHLVAWAVSDVDAPETPALLCQLVLEGPWAAAAAAGIER